MVQRGESPLTLTSNPTCLISHISLQPPHVVFLPQAMFTHVSIEQYAKLKNEERAEMASVMEGQRFTMKICLRRRPSTARVGGLMITIDDIE